MAPPWEADVREESQIVHQFIQSAPARLAAAAAAAEADRAVHRTVAVDFKFKSSRCTSNSVEVAAAGPTLARQRPRRTTGVPSALGTLKSSVPKGKRSVADASGARAGVRPNARSERSGKPLVPCWVLVWRGEVIVEMEEGSLLGGGFLHSTMHLYQNNKEDAPRGRRWSGTRARRPRRRGRPCWSPSPPRSTQRPRSRRSGRRPP